MQPKANVVIITNTLPQLSDRNAVEAAIKSALAEQPGEWRVMLMEPHNASYWTVTITDERGQTWNHRFDGPAEQTAHHIEETIRSALPSPPGMANSGFPKAFVSYSTSERSVSAQVKSSLEELGLRPFLAHEHINVSEEWRSRLIVELGACEVFVPVFSAAFLRSEWAPQEVGFIASRPEVLVVPLSIDGTMPGGFISHLQGKQIPTSGVTTETILDPLARRFPRLALPRQVRIVAKAASFRHAEETMEALVPLFQLLTSEEAQELAAASAENGQIWSAFLCRTKYLPEFLRQHASNISHETRRKLEFQIVNDRWYDAEARNADA